MAFENLSALSSSNITESTFSESTTNSSKNNGTYNSPYSESTAISLAVIALLIAFVGTVGKFLTLLAIWRNSRLKRQTTSVFIANLSASDFLFCSIILPFQFVFYLHRNNLQDVWSNSELACGVLVFSTYVNVGVSFLSITAITINRYIRIVHPGIASRVYTHQNTYLMVGAVWLMGVLPLIPPLTGLFGEIGFDPDSKQCTIYVKGEGPDPKTILRAMFFFVPLFVITFCYGSIFWKVLQSKRTLRIQGAQNPSRDSKFNQEMKLTRMIFLIFFTFVLCFTPALVMTIIDVHGQHYPDAYRLLMNVPAWISNAVNPFVYALSNPQYRRAYWRTMSLKKREKNDADDVQS